MIAGIKLVQDISNCPRISDEDKIRALDDILDMTKTDYIANGLHLETKITNPTLLLDVWLFKWAESKLGFDFWIHIWSRI